MNYRYGMYVLTVLVTFGASFAHAQLLYPTGVPGYGYGYGLGSGSCAYITRDLARGERSEDVRQLQQFIVSRGYPGTGAWMLTGYFGSATEQGVRNFQSESGLPVTGVVDFYTRLAMQGRCAGFGYGTPQYPYTPAPYTPPYAPVNPWYDPYGYPPRYDYVHLDSLSPREGVVGTVLTLYGTGFDRVQNTVRFGDRAASGAVSYNGTSLTVVVPSLPRGTHSVTVTNSRGMSNALPFTVTSSYYNYYDAPRITSINGPTSLPVWTEGTWSLVLNTSYDEYITTSVEWGDEYQYGYGALARSYVTGRQTFTHTYAQRGTYTIRFTVRNERGEENQLSTTVYVY